MKPSPPFDASGAQPFLFPPRKLWILGAGRFGRIAAERLTKRYPEARFLVIDQSAEKLEAIRRDFGVPIRVGDAVSSIASELPPDGSMPDAPPRDGLSDDTWIVPAVPVHVAYLWLIRSLSKHGSVRSLPVPDTLDAQVPNPFRSAGGTLYASNATFLCPDSCSEPDDLCTFTKKPRFLNLFDQINRLCIQEFRVMVVRSRQLAPGVGGYPASCLREVLGSILQEPGAYLVATSCRCHGVIDALETRR